jgi:hypothetical protein
MCVLQESRQVLHELQRAQHAVTSIALPKGSLGKVHIDKTHTNSHSEGHMCAATQCV